MKCSTESYAMVNKNLKPLPIDKLMEDHEKHFLFLRKFFNFFYASMN